MSEAPEPQLATISRVERFRPHGEGWMAYPCDHTQVVGYNLDQFFDWMRQEGNGLYVAQFQDGSARLYSVKDRIVFRVTNLEGQPVLLPVSY